MKKYLAAAVITGLIGAAAFADSNSVASANVLGYNRITVPSNQYVLVALDFTVTNNTISSLFGSLPVASEVLFWNPVSQGYMTVAKSRTGWGTGGTNQLEVGSGAFLKLPVSTNVYLSGDVPLVATTKVYTVNGFKILSYPYPVDMPFTNTALAKGAAVSDEVSIWGTNGWISYARSRTGWGPATNLQLKIGQALLFKTTGTRTNNEVKPYTID